MKKSISWLMPFVLLLFVLVGCGEKQRRHSLPSVSGSANEVLIVMNNSLWESNVGDSVKQYFSQEQIGLPQPEPMFDILHLPMSSFENQVKGHRNILVVQINAKLDSTTFVFKDSPWTNTQKFFEFKSPSASAFLAAFNQHKEMILATFLKAERDRLISVYKLSPDDRVFKLFSERYHLVLNCPGGYNINKASDDFAWISAESQVDSKGIIFYQEKYEDVGQLNYLVIQDKINEVLKKHIPGPLDNTWMQLDQNTPIVATTYNYNQENYAILMRGLWDVKNDFMGGPFILNVVVDEHYGRIIYMMGYIYAPEGKKRNMLRSVEAILFTMGIMDEEKSAE